MTLTTVKTVQDIRAIVKAWQAEGLTVALVPTMGALHKGHLSLITAAKESCDRVIASIFVNPKQFGPNEDLDTYPRQEATDAALLKKAKCDALYLPNVTEMYPTGFATQIQVPALDGILCGASRPVFFTGIATVVSKLLIQASCDQAFFGEKDFQQLTLIKRLATDLNLPTEIHGCPIIREEDGLAASSRNIYLTEKERPIAPSLHQTLQTVKTAVEAGSPIGAETAKAKASLTALGFDVDYLEIRTLIDLSLLTENLDQPARLFAATYLGKTRLIDNLGVSLK
ncbi:MAG: pantoate--beta-alanine ligase [Alphaproteobacteria bacterium]